MTIGHTLSISNAEKSLHTAILTILCWIHSIWNHSPSNLVNMNSDGSIFVLSGRILKGWCTQCVLKNKSLKTIQCPFVPSNPC